MNANEASLRARRIRRARSLLLEECIAIKLMESGIPERHWPARICADLRVLFGITRSERQVRRDLTSFINVQLRRKETLQVSL